MLVCVLVTLLLRKLAGPIDTQTHSIIHTHTSRAHINCRSSAESSVRTINTPYDAGLCSRGVCVSQSHHILCFFARELKRCNTRACILLARRIRAHKSRAAPHMKRSHARHATTTLHSCVCVGTIGWVYDFILHTRRRGTHALCAKNEDVHLPNVVRSRRQRRRHALGNARKGTLDCCCCCCGGGYKRDRLTHIEYIT